VWKPGDDTDERIKAALQGNRAEETQSQAAAKVSLAGAFKLLAPLPDTADELRGIATSFKADSSRDVYLGRSASEKNVKEMRLDTRRVVAFATHGIVPGEISGLDQPALVLSTPP
jgi:CHAT domain-containing protein